MGLRALTLALLLAASGCANRTPRTPEKLRDAHQAALQSGDAKAAYALLSPHVQAQVSYPEFEKRWRAQKAERAAAAKAGKAMPATLKESVRGGTSVHSGGRVLRWTEAGGRYYVTDGLPGVPQTSTPAQTIRALIVAVRTTDMSRVRALLGDELAEAIHEDWQSRVEAMEAALDRPGAIELSSDLRRAELRYEPNRVLTLEQTPRGWRVTSLE